MYHWTAVLRVCYKYTVVPLYCYTYTCTVVRLHLHHCTVTSNVVPLYQYCYNYLLRYVNNKSARYLHVGDLYRLCFTPLTVARPGQGRGISGEVLTCATRACGQCMELSCECVLTAVACAEGGWSAGAQVLVVRRSLHFSPFLFASAAGGLGFASCVLVVCWRHAFRSEWPFINFVAAVACWHVGPPSLSGRVVVSYG